MLSYAGWRGAVMMACVVGVGSMAWAEDAAAGQSKEEMVARYMELAQPGPEHQVLAAMAGSFVIEGTSYCDPTGEPQKVGGKQTGRMILGGRFLQCEFEGQMTNMPFQGMGLTGYDNVKKKYIGLWADTMGTAWMTSEGHASDGGKVITLIGSYDDPVTGKKTTMRQVTRILDEDRHTFEMYGPNPDPASDGAEMKMMELEYRRAE